MVWTVTATNPKYNLTGGAQGATGTLPVASLGLEQNMDMVSAMVLLITADIASIYENETTATNPLQQFSTIFFKRDSAYWFRGYVYGKLKSFDFPTGRMLQVTVWGKEGILIYATIPDTNGSPYWTLETDSIQVTNLPLLETTTYGEFEGDTLWPDPDDVTGAKCYIKDASSNFDALDVAIGVGTYAITALSAGAGGWFEVADNVPAEFVADDRFTISGSTNNNGTWTVASASWTGTATRIVVDETVLAVADGGITNPNIILSVTSKGFNPRGWAKIGSEWIYYDGYDNSAADTKYRLRNCVRGQLGTSAAAHLAAVTVYEKVAKQIAPGMTRIEKNHAAVWDIMRIEKEVQSVPKLGCFVMAGTTEAGDTYRGTYFIYDEDYELGGTYILTLNDIIKKMLTAPLAHGGPGFKAYDIDAVDTVNKRFDISENVPTEFVAGDYIAVTDSTGNDGYYTIVSSAWTGAVTRITVSETIASATPDGYLSTSIFFHSSTAAILVNRYDYDPSRKPQNVYDAIQDLLTELSLEEEIKFWYRHDIDKFRMRVIANDSSAFTVPFLHRIDDEKTIENVYSGVRVQYEGDQAVNIIYDIWHTDATGVGAKPDRWVMLQNDSGSWNMDEISNSTAAGNYGKGYIIDGDPTTVLKAEYTHSPAASIHFCDCVFGPGTVPPIVPLGSIKAAINTYRAIDASQSYQNSSKTYLVRFYGCDDYDTTSEATRNAATWVDLGFALEGKPNPYGKWLEEECDEFRMRNVNAVRVIWDYMPGPKDGADYYWAVMHDLKITGAKKYVTVQLTDDVTKVGDPLYIYAPLTYQKLRGSVGASNGSGGAQKILPYDIGVGTYESAISAARTLLLTRLRDYEARHYGYSGLLPTKPECGLTIAVDEDGDGSTDYTGVIRSISIQKTGLDALDLQVTVLDADTAVIT